MVSANRDEDLNSIPESDSGFTLNFDANSEPDYETLTSIKSRTLLALTASLAIHAVVLMLLLEIRFEKVGLKDSPQLLQVKFLSVDEPATELETPLLVAEEEPVPLTSPPEPEPEAISVSAPEPAEPQAADPPTQTTEIALPAVNLPTPESAEPRLKSLPSIVSVNRSIDAVASDSQERSWTAECNLLQKQSGIQTCEEDEQRDYKQLQRNSTYEALNPIRPRPSRGRETARIIAGETENLVARLNAANIPADLQRTILKDLEANIDTYFGELHKGAAMGSRMTNKGVAAVFFQGIADDPWIQSAVEAIMERTVHLN